jgi:protein-disulfide isomerase
MKKFYFLFGGIAAIGIGVVGYNVGSSVFGDAVSAPIVLDLENDEELVALAQGVMLGDPDAPLTIMEFGDYQCPGCGAFALSVKPRLVADYVETGQARFVFYDFPIHSIHPHAFLAARAARCAGDQDLFWEYHEMLFRNQARWSAEATIGGTLSDYAGEVGLDRGDFNACVNSDKYADVVTANLALGERMNVQSTPTVLVNANGMLRKVATFDFNTIVSAIDIVTSEGPGSN